MSERDCVVNDKEIDRIIDNDREWRRFILTNQAEIKKDVKDMREDYAQKQVDCEGRFTKIETKSGLIAGGVGLVIAGIFEFFRHLFRT